MAATRAVWGVNRILTNAATSASDEVLREGICGCVRENAEGAMAYGRA